LLKNFRHFVTNMFRRELAHKDVTVKDD